MSQMHYKGYPARIEYSEEDLCFIGRIAGIRDIVGFHGESVEDLKNAFREAVDDYLATCDSLNRSPQRPYSGRVMLRIDPATHARAAMSAEAEGKSLNRWIAERIENSAE